MITMIPRSKLEPHPDNPRKELGDLTELAASIARSGLLQNLTVVPSPAYPDKYRIIIGHRRFAASGIAGLKELPCSIEDMDMPTQIATMIAENMQRSDLTISDQVSGVQTMLDLGENATGIAVKTGLSTTTIRKREKLAKLDFAKLKAAEQRGATLLKLMEVEAIENPQQRERALDALGTPDYNSVMYDIQKELDREKYLPLIEAALNRFAEKVEKPLGSYYRFFNFSQASVDEIQKMDSKSGKFSYVLMDYYAELYIAKDETQTEEERLKMEAKARIEKRVQAERELRKKFETIQKVFLSELYCRGLDAVIQRFVLWSMTRTDYQTVPRKGGLLGGGMSECDASITGAISPTVGQIETHTQRNADTLKLLLFAAYDRAQVMDNCLIEQYSGKYSENAQNAKDLYGFLELMGYPTSDEEKQWLNGMHECFREEETK